MRNPSTSESTKFSREQPSPHLPPHLPSEHRNIQEALSSKVVGGTNSWQTHQQRAGSSEGLTQSPLSATGTVIIIPPDRCWCSSIKFHGTSSWKSWLAVSSLPLFMKMKCQTGPSPNLRPPCAGPVQNYKGHDSPSRYCFSERQEGTGTDEGERERRQYGAHPCSCMKVNCMSLSVMGISYRANHFVSLLNCLWREHMFTFFFFFFISHCPSY